MFFICDFIGLSVALGPVPMLDEPNTMKNNQLTDVPPHTVIFGKSALMLELQNKLQRVLGTKLPILLQGESGAGKDTLSKFIHNNSRNIEGSRVKVNCSDNPSILLELVVPTLVENRPGPSDDIRATQVGLSSIGTLFLDEVGELSLTTQLRLLHSLPDGQDSGDAGNRNPWASTRLISATARNLRQEVNEKKFRRDLFYRLAVVTLEVPPLRNRLDDLLIIANYLRQIYCKNFELPEVPFPGWLIERMHKYEWPGNIRELENFVCRYVILGPEERVVHELDSHSAIAAARTIRTAEAPLKEVTRRTLANVEREMIVKALDLHQGSLKRAAQTLGISYRTLMNKMDQAGLPRVRHATRSRNGLES